MALAESESEGKNQELDLRELGPADFPALAALERECFAFPWSEEELRVAFTRPGFTALGGYRDGRLVCYSLLLLVPPEMEILNLAVSTESRRLGLGSRILAHALQWAAKKGITTISLEARRSNSAALALYAAFDFKPVGLRRGYYQDTGEDAILLQLQIGREEP